MVTIKIGGADVGIAYDEFLTLRDNDRPFSHTDRDTMLYALAAGMGRDPLDTAELPFVFEGAGLKAMPSMAAVLTRSPLARTLPIDMTMLLHGEQRLEIHQPVPPAANILASTRITEIIDKGAGKGALIYDETIARDADSGEPLYTVRATLFARGDGGFGGPPSTPPTPHAIPARAPDIVHITQTRPDQALLYRLCGDRNPLHADPALAVRAGFPVPILHGLCTYAIACRAVLASVCDFDPARIRTFDLRFTSPVLPGDTLETDIWIDGDTISFRCRVPARNVVAIDNGRSDLNPPADPTTRSLQTRTTP